MNRMALPASCRRAWLSKLALGRCSRGSHGHGRLPPPKPPTAGVSMWRLGSSTVVRRFVSFAILRGSSCLVLHIDLILLMIFKRFRMKCFILSTTSDDCASTIPVLCYNDMLLTSTMEHQSPIRVQWRSKRHSKNCALYFSVACHWMSQLFFVKSTSTCLHHMANMRQLYVS